MDKTQFIDAHAAAYRSPRVWADCPILEIAMDPSKGRFLFDDFMHGFAEVVGDGTLIKVVESVPHRYASMLSNNAGNKVTPLHDKDGKAEHALRLTVRAADNEAAGLGLYGGIAGGAVKAYGPCDFALGPSNDLWFEARIRPQQITDQDFFIGLGKVGLLASATAVFTDADAMADNDMIGFFCLGGTTALDFRYKKTGQTAQAPKTGLVTLVADAWNKVGFKWIAAEKRLAIVVNNVELPESFAPGAAATWPSGVAMQPYAVAKAKGAVAITGWDVDWWGAATKF